MLNNYIKPAAVDAMMLLIDTRATFIAGLTETWLEFLNEKKKTIEKKNLEMFFVWNILVKHGQDNFMYKTMWADSSPLSVRHALFWTASTNGPTSPSGYELIIWISLIYMWLLCKKYGPNQATILHMPWQQSCRDMCKIVTRLYH